jgi:hypothetical protein
MGYQWELQTEDAFQLVLQYSYFIPIPDQPFKQNVVEVTVLGKGGLQILSFEKAYYLVHIVLTWVLKNCTVTRRKKHVLSSLRSRTADQQIIESAA